MRVAIAIPCPTSGQLDINIISDVPQPAVKYTKPIVAGESHLSAETPDTHPANADNGSQSRSGNQTCDLRGRRVGHHE